MAFTRGRRSVEQAFNKLQKNYAELASIIEDEMGLAALDEAAAIIEEAQRRVPVDTGALRHSAFIGKVKRTGDDAQVDFGFLAPYAKIQHDNESYNHKIGEAKYLEKAIRSKGVLFKVKLSDRTTRQMRARLSTRITANIRV